MDMDSYTGQIVDDLLRLRQSFIGGLIEEMRARIPELDHDAGIVRLLEASVTENVVGGINALLHDVDGDQVDAPDSALVYARTLARNGVPLSALTRAYRVGHSRFMDLVFGAGVSLPAEARAETLARLVRRSTHWLDEVTAQVAQAYEAEREAWLSGNDGVRRRVVSDLLEHRGIDAGQASRVLGYRFDGTHRCALVQVDRAGRAGGVVDELRHGFRARAHLAVELGDGVTAVWLTVSDLEEIPLLGEQVVGVRVALGRAEDGIDGFRRTYRQAERVRLVLSAASGETQPGVDGRAGWARFDEIAPLALMVHDLDELRGFVRRRLGDLGRPDGRSDMLRRTLWTYLARQSNVSATAADLTLHRNSVQYRVERAVELLPDRTLPSPAHDLQVALQAACWLGPAALE